MFKFFEKPSNSYLSDEEIQALFESLKNNSPNYNPSTLQRITALEEAIAELALKED